VTHEKNFPAPPLSRRGLLQTALGASAALALGAGPLRAAPLKKITFQLDWIAYGRHVPYYVALEKGYFAQAGLDVNIEQGTGAMPGFRYLAADRAQFVFQDIGSMIAARVRANLKMKAVSCVYQKAPHTAFFIKGKGITAPKDLEGKKLGFSAGNSPKIMFPAFAAANHIDESKLNWLAADPNSLNSLLLDHQANVILTYLFTLPVLQKSAQNGEQIGTFVYSDFGANFYANGIVAMEDYIAANPDVVRGFVKAVKQGFEYTAAHPQDAVALMKKHQPQLNADTALKELPILARLSTSDDTKAHGFGIMTESKMQETADLIAKYMDLKSEVPIHDLYTNDFLS
jgi:NitT/TauT family transport system substrate-binding protein